MRGLALSPVDEYVLHHHERWDGGGYPHGLAGAAIPFGSRLILVADAFDALTSTARTAPASRSRPRCRSSRRRAGAQFDPLVVAALHDVLAQQHAGELPTPGQGREWSLSTSPS